MEAHKYEHLAGEEVLPTNQCQMIEHAKLTCSPLEKAFGKTNEEIGWCCEFLKPL